MASHGKIRSGSLMAAPPRPMGAIGVLCASLWLSACGGGGGGASAPPPPPPPPPATALPDLDIVAPAQADLGAAVALSTSAVPAAALKVQWDFGDGTSGTEAAPQHSFARAGDLTVKLTLTNEAGTQKTYSKAISLSNKVLVKGNYCSGANDQGWCWMPPHTSGSTVRDLQFLDANMGWRSDELGDVFKTTDGGKSWTRQPTGVTADLNRIVVRSAQDLVAVSASANLIVISEDGGKSWQKQMLPTSTVPQFTEVYALGQGKVLARRFEDWDPKTAQYLDRTAGSWQQLTLGPFEQLSVGSDGSILTYSAGRLMRRASPLAAPQLVYSLPPLATPASQEAVVLSRTNTQVVWMTRAYGNSTYNGQMILYRSVDGGQNWDAIPQSFSGLRLAYDKLPRMLVSDASATNVAMTTYMDGSLSEVRMAALWQSADGGSTWTARRSGGIYPYDSVSCGSSGTSVLCYSGGYGSSYTTEVSQDYGATFGPGRFGQTNPAGGRLVINTRLGAGVSSLDFAVQWPIYAGIDTRSMSAPEFAAPAPSFGSRKMGRRVLNGSVFTTTDGGRSWTETGQLLSGGGKDVLGLASQKTAEQTVTSLSSASMLDESTTLLLAADGKVLVSRDAGATWTRPAELNLSGLTLSKLQFQDATQGWALGTKDGAARLVVTRDAGKTWRSLDFIPAATPVVVLLGAGQELTLADANGSIYRSTNEGGTWTNPGSVGSPVGDVFASKDGTSYWAAASAGGVFKSTDKGATWQKTQLSTTANLMAACFADDRNGWVAGQAGQLWATNDGGTSWRRQAVPTTQDMTSLNCQDSRTVWVGGRKGLLATGTGGE